MSLSGQYLTLMAGYSDFGAVGGCSDTNVQAYSQVGYPASEGSGGGAELGPGVVQFLVEEPFTS